MSAESKYDQLSVGTIAGIVFGGIGGLVVLFMVVLCFCNLCKRKEQSNNDSAYKQKTLKTSKPANDNRLRSVENQYVNGGFLPDASAPSIADLNSPPPSYQNAITGNI